MKCVFKTHENYEAYAFQEIQFGEGNDAVFCASVPYNRIGNLSNTESITYLKTQTPS